jgi:hypothetical protein
MLELLSKRKGADRGDVTGDFAAVLERQLQQNLETLFAAVKELVNAGLLYEDHRFGGASWPWKTDHLTYCTSVPQEPVACGLTYTQEKRINLFQNKVVSVTEFYQAASSDSVPRHRVTVPLFESIQRAEGSIGLHCLADRTMQEHQYDCRGPYRDAVAHLARALEILQPYRRRMERAANRQLATLPPGEILSRR